MSFLEQFWRMKPDQSNTAGAHGSCNLGAVTVFSRYPYRHPVFFSSFPVPSHRGSDVVTAAVKTLFIRTVRSKSTESMEVFFAIPFAIMQIELTHFNYWQIIFLTYCQTRVGATAELYPGTAFKCSQCFESVEGPRILFKLRLKDNVVSMIHTVIKKRRMSSKIFGGAQNRSLVSRTTTATNVCFMKDQRNGSNTQIHGSFLHNGCGVRLQTSYRLTRKIKFLIKISRSSSIFIFIGSQVPNKRKMHG